MDKQGIDDQITKLKAAVAEQATRAVDGNNDLAARIAEIRDALGEVIEKAANERAKCVSLADVTKERLKAVEEAMPQGQSEEEKERLAKLEKSLGERTDELNASKKRIADLEKTASNAATAEKTALERVALLEKDILGVNDAAAAAKQRIAQLEKSLSDQAEASQSAVQRAAQLEKELMDRNDAAQAARNRIVTLEKELESHASAGEGVKQKIEKLEKGLLEKSEVADAARKRVEQLEKELNSREGREFATKEKVAELEKALGDARNAGKSSEEKLKALWDQVAAEKSAAEAAGRRVAELEKSLEKGNAELAALKAATQSAGENEKKLAAEHKNALDQLDALRKQLEANKQKLADADSLPEKLDQLKKLLNAEKERADARELQLEEERKKGTKSALAQQLAEALKDREEAQEEVVRLRSEVAQLRSAAPVAAKPVNQVEEKIRKAATGDGDDARRRMGDILVDAGVINEKQLHAALEEQHQFPQKRLGSILVEKKFASEDVVAQALAFQRNVEFIRIKAETIDTAAARLISGRLAEHHGCIPVGTFRGKMTLAMINPLDLIAIEDVERASNHQVEPVVATASDIMNWIREIYD